MAGKTPSKLTPSNRSLESEMEAGILVIVSCGARGLVIIGNENWIVLCIRKSKVLAKVTRMTTTLGNGINCAVHVACPVPVPLLGWM